MASDPAIAELASQLALVNARLAQMQSGARSAAAAADGLASSSTAGARALGSVDAALMSIGREGGVRALGAIQQWIADVPAAAARAEAHQRALDTLGSAYDAVSRATNGAVSAEQAAAVQQRAAQSGIRLTAQELAVVTQRARDYAHATGTELGQALDQLTDQLVDPGEELRKFGVFLQTGMTAGDALKETLRQLGAQAAQTAPAAQTLAEANEEMARAGREASDALSGMIAQEIGLRDFFQSLTSWIHDATGEASVFGGTLDTVIGSLREVWGIRHVFGTQEAAHAANQSVGGAFLEQAGPMAEQLRRQGVTLGGVNLARLAATGSPEQRARAMAMLQRAVNPARPAAPRLAGGGRNREFEVDDGPSDAEERAAAAAARAQRATIARDLVALAEQVEQEAVMREAEAEMERGRDESISGFVRRDEIDRRNRPPPPPPGRGRSSGGISDTSQHTIGGPAGALLDRLVDEERARERASGNLERALEAARRQTEATQAERDAQVGFTFPRVGATLGERADNLDLWRRGEEAGARRDDRGGIANADRVRILTEQRDALRALTDEATRAEQQARDSHASQSDVNDLMRQRIGLQQSLVETTRDLTEATREQTEWMEPWKDSMQQVGENVLQGVSTALWDALEGTKAFDAAIHDMLKTVAKSTAQQAIFETLKATAEGFGHLSKGNVFSATKAFKSAGLWAATGVVAGGIAGALSASSSPASSGGDSSARSASTDRPARADRDRNGGGPLVINVAVSGAAFTDAGVHQAVASALRGATSSGYLTSTDLRGLYG